MAFHIFTGAGCVVVFLFFFYSLLKINRMDLCATRSVKIVVVFFFCSVALTKMKFKKSYLSILNLNTICTLEMYY